MSDTNPLFDIKFIKAGDVVLRLVQDDTRHTYNVGIYFPLDAFRVYASKFVNPLRVALEAAEEALNALRCECFNLELNEGKPYEKPKDEEKKE